MSLDVGTKCETCLPSASLATGLNKFVLCYKIKWAKERSNRESRGFVTEGVDGRMAEYIQTNTQGLHGSVVHATVKEYLKILNSFLIILQYPPYGRIIFFWPLFWPDFQCYSHAN